MQEKWIDEPETYFPEPKTIRNIIKWNIAINAKIKGELSTQGESLPKKMKDVKTPYDIPDAGALLARQAEYMNELGEKIVAKIEAAMLLGRDLLIEKKEDTGKYESTIEKIGRQGLKDLDKWVEHYNRYEQSDWTISNAIENINGKEQYLQAYIDILETVNKMDVDINKPVEVKTEDFLRAFGYMYNDTIYCRYFYDPNSEDPEHLPDKRQAKLQSFDGLQKELQKKNAERYGIYFVVNGDGQSDKDVKHARAQFMEIDDRPFDEQLEIIGNFPVEPSIIVKTRKSLHTYWLLKDGDIKRFREIQGRLVAYFGADPRNINESRVMRLPNFKHNKQDPVDVIVIKYDPQLKYTQDEIEAVLPAIAPAATSKTPYTSESLAEYVIEAGGRHNAIMSIGGKIRSALPPDVLDAAIRGINNSFAEPLDDKEISKYIRDLQRYNENDERIEQGYESHKAENIGTIEEYEAQSAADLAGLDALIEYTGNTPALSTGFSALDVIIDDGVRNGFYVIGAISSLGKTTFCLQICDNLAKQGQDVLFYSLEMSKSEIQAKSISRESLQVSIERYGDTSAAKTSTGIMNGRRVKAYRDNDAETVKAARAAYQTYAGHIHIIEATGNISVKEIEADVLKHKSLTGKDPVIIIDYLQLLAPYEAGRNLSDKQITDRNVLALKQLSRSLPVLAISSFNRESYTEPVTLSAFKESGSIEYTSDILIGLQYAGMDYLIDEKETGHKTRVAGLIREQKANGKAGNGQNIQLKVLKNRHGTTGDIGIVFYPAFNYYKEEDPFTSKEQATYKRI